VFANNNIFNKPNLPSNINGNSVISAGSNFVGGFSAITGP